MPDMVYGIMEKKEKRMINDMQKETLKLGQEVWYMDTYDNLRSGIAEQYHEKMENYVKIRGTQDNYGTQYIDIAECHSTKEDALAAAQNKSQERVNKFLQSIKTPEDLVQFMYEHTVSHAEEYTDWDARKAASIAAKEIMGIDLEGERDAGKNIRSAMEPSPSLEDAIKQLQTEMASENSL